MKVYGGTFGGRNRLIVAAKSKREAHRAISAAAFGRLSYYSFSQFATDTGNDLELATALASPGVVFSQDTRDRHNPFVPLPGPPAERR